MAINIFSVYVSRSFSCSSAIHTRAHTHIHARTHSSSSWASLSLLLFALLPQPPPSSLVSLGSPLCSPNDHPGHKKYISSLASTLIRRQENQWNSNYFHVFEVRRNINHFIFFSVLHRKTNSNWASTTNSQDRHRTIWKESWRVTKEKNQSSENYLPGYY